MPFLGIQFDVNDLGALSAIGQSLIALLIAFSMARYQENLYICLWKVKRFAEDQGSFDDEKGHANMFYHSLAMAQVLSQPPTLARWEHNRIVELTSRSILFMPMAVQGIILYQDSKTFATGVSMSRSATMMSLQLQYLFFAILATCTCISLLYARAGDMRWARTFFVLNPRLRPIRQPSWWQWTSLIRNLNLHLEYDPDQEILVFGERHRSGRVHTVGLYLRSTFSPQLARPRARAKSWTGPSGQKLEFCPYGQGSALFRSSSISINQIAVGGKPKFSDGEGRAAGIGKIHAPLEVMVPFWSIFFVDGPRLRRIRTGTQQLRVETIAGDPFRAQRLRPFLPRLLDLAATDSSLLVADLDQRTVWALPLQEEIVAEDVRAYFRSESGWAPSRLLVRQPPEGKPTQTFLLEERPLDFKGLILRIFGRYRLLDISDPKEPIYLWGYG